jgi:hypothetical protein
LWHNQPFEKFNRNRLFYLFYRTRRARQAYIQVFEQSFFVSDYALDDKILNGKLTDVLYNASVYKDDKGEVLGVFAAAQRCDHTKYFIRSWKQVEIH